MAETKKMVLDIDASKSNKSVKELRQEIKAIQDQMVNLEEGSDAFLELANKAGEAKHQIDEINRSTRAASADFGDLMVHTAKIGASMIGSFQAVKGAMTLLGVESENVEKAIEKMQASMALVQGLQSIDQGVKSFKTLTTAIKGTTKGLGGFKTALIATGLGALVVVLGSIIANWDEFTESIGLSEKQLNKLGETFKGVVNVIKGSIKLITQAITKAVSGDFEGAIDIFKNQFNFAAMYAEGVAQAVAEREEEAAKQSAEAWKAYTDKRQEQLDTEIAKANATISDELELRKELIRIEQERLKLYKEGSKEYYETLSKINELNNKTAEEQAKANEEQAKAEAEKQKQREKEEADRQKTIEGYRNEAQSVIDSARTEIEVFDDKIKHFEELRELDLENAELYNNAIVELEKRKADSQTKIDEEQAQKAADIQQAKLETFYAFSNSFTSLLDTLADSMDENNKEQFEAMKAFQISSAVVSTITGAIQAYLGASTNSGINAIPIVGPAIAQALGITNAAVVAASGAAQIAKIAKTKFGDKSAGGATISNRGGTSVNPSTLQSAMSPVQYTQDVQGASIEQGIKDTRVYVVESDITNTQNKVYTAESENRF